MILVFDLGTTYFKFSLFGSNGQLVDWRQIAPPTRITPDGLAELDAADFTATIIEGVSQLQKSHRECVANIRAVTFASQTNSFVLLDRDNHPLTPIILWTDRRAAAMNEEVEMCRELPGFTSITGLPTLTCLFMVAKLLWIQRHCQDIWNRTEKVCLISDYLTLLLTGRHVTEAGAAGLTGMVDIRNCSWWPTILSRLAVPSERLPKIVRAGTCLGPINGNGAELGCLPAECSFVVGCLDQYAGAIGLGNVTPNIVSETTGTVLATVQCADRLLPNCRGRVFQGPAFRDGLYYRMMSGQVSARYLEWYRGQLPDRPDFSELVEAASKVEPGAAGLTLRTDVELSSVETVFAGLTKQHTRGHIVRCIMEAVAESLQQQVATISGGVSPTEVRSAGGAARSDLWLQIKADSLGVPMIATQCPEPTSLGAAILAEASTGGDDVAEIARRWVQVRSPRPIEPQRS